MKGFLLIDVNISSGFVPDVQDAEKKAGYH